MKKGIRPELLSPAGNLTKLKYAFAYGADAVYAGVPRFSLRTRENDFREESLIEGIQYAHALGKKVYLTLNIYAHNTKVDGFIRELEKIAEWKPDGLIMADPGLIHQAIKRVPHIPVHLSTQANATNWTTVDFWKDLGVKRIILSRELRLKEISEIHEKVAGIELECFVHGAICIAYSGRCLISNYMNHRDANQGTCTNSCRWEYDLKQKGESLVASEKNQDSISSNGQYASPGDGFFVEEKERTGEEYPMEEDENGTYLFNAKDLCAVELLEDIRDTGVMSFKIEGRTKSEYYAAMVTRSYRKAIDDMVEGKPFDLNNLNDLTALSNRGYTTGFYARNPKEYGENYHDNRSLERSHKALGMNCQWEQSTGRLWFDVKNRLEVGTDIELFYPEGKESVHVSELQNEKGEKVNVVHGGGGRAAFPLEKDPGIFAVLRRGLNEKEVGLLMR
ncbi:MAG: tRNA 5-hydroxyuridine modification protein YegQ [Candidatus Marinimicrobia bacterium]|nr:tRNA 5-hydroxyuridine modification protein YegQ [Candidatus Neomarinimicrobiota bacterium]MBL7009671.1 tRNA 5-hydroxyuridine modification protein YegQ [Candidatus Neomarinimicrobiota bacterium]MBL7029586.1 tRNA 5-hydroxyuridine modification protein YegQ [Candidatus Neomarinimicrobiota bacterium]